MASSRGWIGVDLDGTLAEYGEWKGPEHVGRPILLMVERVAGWIAAGIDVRIFTARVGPQKDAAEVERARIAIELWCEQHLGVRLPVTATKDYAMVELWDDHCVQVITNTGKRADGEP